MNWLSLVKLLIPIVLAALKVPHGDIISAAASQGIAEAEQIKGASGADKLAHAVNITNIGIDAANASGAKLDKDAINTTLASGISTAVDVANLITKKS